MSRRSFLLTLLLTTLTVALIAADEASGGWLLGLRAPLALFFLLFLPGYALQAALLPRSTNLTVLERGALSAGLSVALIAPLVLILDSLGWGVRLWPITFSMSVLTVVLATIAFLQSRHIAPPNPTLAETTALREWWQTQSPRQRRLILAALVSVTVVSAYTILWLVTPHSEHHFTEFYLLGAGGAAEVYPQSVRVGQPLDLSLGVSNYERQEEIYLILAKSGEQIVGYHEPFRVPRSQSSIQTLTVTMPIAGKQQRVDILLLRPNETTPYRQLFLWLDVEP